MSSSTKLLSQQSLLNRRPLTEPNNDRPLTGDSLAMERPWDQGRLASERDDETPLSALGGY
jgi:hypothetical protein